jgi:hypothetical protein
LLFDFSGTEAILPRPFAEGTGEIYRPGAIALLFQPGDFIRKLRDQFFDAGVRPLSLMNRSNFRAVSRSPRE